MAMYKDGISPQIRYMVEKINMVGVKELRDYCDKHKPKMNFRRQIKIVRAVAHKGYTYAALEYGVSGQAAENTLKRMYKIALEVEALHDEN